MAASEVAVSLVIITLHDLLSKSEDIIDYQKLRDQIPDFISKLCKILTTRKHTELNDGHKQETQEGEEQLLLCARNAEKIAEAFLLDLLQHQRLESQEGRFTRGFGLVQLFSVKSRACARKKTAKAFATEVELLCSKFTSSQPPANGGMLDNESLSSSSLSKRNRENMRQRVESDIVGRSPYVVELLGLLIKQENDNDLNLRVISVVGKQACGKTALVKSVFSRLIVKHHFDCRTWVHVSGLGEKSDWMKNLLVDILKQTRLGDWAKDLEYQPEEQLFEMLHKSLMGFRYLIVLDNLREASLINELLVPFMDSMNGSRVIVTTPNAEMQKFADPWTPDLRLSPDMTDEECLKLLQVNIMGDDNMEFKQKILSKCNGSPPAISLLGGLLSAVEESNWVALIDRLGEHPTLDDITRLSFDELPYMMKPFVLYMALFPKESEVPTRRLLRLWAAEGLLAEAPDRSVQMPSAEDCFCELESRNLICVVRRKLNGSARSCRMPAFIHEFFLQKAKELGLLQIQYCSDSVFDAEQSSQHQQKQMQNTATGHYGYKVQCLRSFVLFNTRKLGRKAKIGVLLKSSVLGTHLILLRVLDLEGVYKPVLPKKFGYILPNLRYLGLRWTVLDFIPESVGNLLFLETLDLKHTNITNVTSSIWNAKNLRHLYLSEASFDKSIQRQISPGKFQNTKLETLWGLFIESSNSPMINVLEKLASLKKLGVTCQPEAVMAVKECVSKLSGLESLRLRSRDLYDQPLEALGLRTRDVYDQPLHALRLTTRDLYDQPEDLNSRLRDLFSNHARLNLSDMTGVKSLLNLYFLGSLRPTLTLSQVLSENLKVLTLSMSELQEDPMRDLACLNNLIILRLLARSYSGIKLRCFEGFPKLRVLKLWMLEELRDLVVWEGAMPCLEELEIRQCQNLGRVYWLDHINSLKSVSLTGVVRGDVFVSPHTLVKPPSLKRSHFWL